ncbi:MAG TPA: tetratricopeptide repeat protein, partial [Blastocatellia bacterium]|nr:tetratricopeptide repeat protein [Blastocatellia bacterium]
IVLSAPVKLWIDAEAFEQSASRAIRGQEVVAYEAALGLYTGDLLAEDLYEEWAALRREQLRAEHQNLLLKLAELLDACGEYRQSIERLKQLLACDSTNEEAHRKLMRLYALTGNKHQALRQYQLCSEALRKGLDAEPESVTIELREQILSGRLAPLPSSNEAERRQDSGPALNSIAILPLINGSNDPNTEYLCGISENIIYRLSQLPGLRVMACSTVCHYKGREVDPRDVGHDLNVRAVLTGRVLQMGDALIIRTELVDAATGEQLWGEQYNRRLSDILALQEEISRDISEKLRLKLTREEQAGLTRRHTDDAEAYQLFLKGRYFWNKRTGEGLKKSIEYFQKAITKDPDYAAAYAGLSDCYTNMVGRHGLTAQEGLYRARIAAIKALEIDDTLAEAHTALAHAMLHNWEWAEAERHFRRAIKLNPADPTAHQTYYEYLSAVGRMEEAIAEIKEAQEIDPLSLPINSSMAAAFYYSRQYDRSIEQCQRVLEMDTHFYWAHVGLARAYEQTGLFDDAITESEKALEISQENMLVLAALGRIYAVAGRREAAQDVLRSLIAKAESHLASPYSIALIYAGLGDDDQAFKWLETAYRERDGVMTHLKVTPRLDGLRHDARFQNLLHRIGLAQ